MRYPPLPLKRGRDPFDDPNWIFELKLDGFRAVAVIEDGRARLISRNGNVFRSRHLAGLQHEIPSALRVSSAVLDGDLVVLNSDGRPQFYDLKRGRGTPPFVAR